MVAPVLGERAVYVSSEGIGVWVLKIRARLCAAVPGRMKVIWFCVVVSCTSMASDAASTFSLVSIKVTRARACAHFCVVVAALCESVDNNGRQILPYKAMQMNK
mmetsp:Transcript_24660/g.38213  ORF Transcript_24660/g.38213 Transcript_24660/m.38213 type:complete len:104 (+) Transcript_24660:568-879(+)